MEQFKNEDGTYTSPKNGKTYKSLKAFTAHWHYAGHVNPNNFAKRLYNLKCQFCEKDVIVSNHKKHENSCYLNPDNIKLCKVCEKPIKDYKKSKGTCSHSCSNKLFSHLRNKPEKYKRYTTLCWKEHKKECIICGENKIVAVHHMNEDHEDNRPENLVPLCPTHHTYMHSKYKEEILPKVEEYLKNFKLRFA
jgi:hypothetical protein